MKVLVLSSKPYSIENENGDIKGSSLWYTEVKEPSTEGCIPMKLSISQDSEFYGQTLGTYPAICEVEYGMVSGKGNKPTLKVVDFTRVSSVNLNDIAEF